jgi:RNA polymerase nonessential primary-like sigma factor
MSGTIDIILGLDLLNDLFTIVDEHPVLPEVENKALARLARAGDRDARDKLILHNLRLVVAVVKPYLRTHIIRTQLAQDIIHEGIIGLAQGIDKYNPDLGYKFSTYAVWWIRQSIHRWYSQQTQVSLSQHAFDHMIKIRQCYAKGITDPVEIAQDAQLALHHVEYALSYLQLSYRSLDVVFADEEDQGLTFGDLLPDEIDEYESLEDTLAHQEIVRSLIAVLPASDQNVVRKLYGLDGEEKMSPSQLAKHLGVSRQRVDQIYRRAKDHMRRVGLARGVKAS